MDTIIESVKTLLLIYAFLGIALVSASSYLIYKIFKNLNRGD